MPQMAPYNWLILFVFFNYLIIFIISINYYMMIKSIFKSKITSQNFNYKWMWK